MAALTSAVALSGTGAAQQAAARPKTANPATPPAATGKNGPVTVDADSLESMQKEGLSVFKGSVVAKQNNSVQYADRMEVYTDSKTDRIERVVSTGNVRIMVEGGKQERVKAIFYQDRPKTEVKIGPSGPICP